MFCQNICVGYVNYLQINMKLQSYCSKDAADYNYNETNPFSKLNLVKRHLRSRSTEWYSRCSVFALPYACEQGANCSTHCFDSNSLQVGEIAYTSIRLQVRRRDHTDVNSNCIFHNILRLKELSTTNYWFISKALLNLNQIDYYKCWCKMLTN